MKGAPARRSLSMRIGGPVSIGVYLLVAGCAGQANRPAPTEVTRIPQNGDWFCQLAPEGQGWECVQDPELADDPRPARLPEPAAPPEPAPAPLPVPEPDRPPVQPGPDAVPEAGPEATPPPEDAAPPPGPAPTPEPADPPTTRESPEPQDGNAASRPAYARLAYQPREPRPLTDLPREFYAVQVLAMSSREQLESFVQRHRIRDVSAARVERDGELFYVLLLGIYENLDTARRAIRDLPQPLAGIEPWIRPLGSLQSAMRRADALAGAASS